MSIVSTAGKKPNWAMPINIDNVQDMFGLTAAAAAKLSMVNGWSIKDGEDRNINEVHCTVREADITLTDYAAFDIGSTIMHTGAATPTLYVKCASSSPGVIGDWYLEELTQAS